MYISLYKKDNSQNNRDKEMSLIDFISMYQYLL